MRACRAARGVEPSRYSYEMESSSSSSRTTELGRARMVFGGFVCHIGRLSFVTARTKRDEGT